MSRHGLRSCCLVAIALATGSLAGRAQGFAPRDLDGIWNYATMTPLERPRDFAAKATLTPRARRHAAHGAPPTAPRIAR